MNIRDPRRDRGRHPLFEIAAVSAVVVLAVTIRLWDLRAQSTWGDDYILVGFLDATNWFAFRADTRAFNPDMPELFYALSYAWSRVAGHTPEAIRLLSVGFGTIAVVLTYVAGRVSFGKKAGLIAALCITLSPLHIYHSQGMRGYALVVLLGLISAITCLRMLRGGSWRWWAANSIANTAMLWTHLTSGLLIATWLLAILFWQRRPNRRWLAWLMVPAVSALPLLTLFGRVLGSSGEFHPARPGLWETMMRPAAWTLVREADYLLGAWPRTEYFQDGMLSYEALAPFHLAAVSATVLTLVSLAVVFGFAGMTIRAIAKCRAASLCRRARAQEDLITHSWLWLWCAVPAVGLALAAHFVDPSRTSVRYILFASPALYLMAGAAISQIRSKPLGNAFVALLIGSLAALMYSNAAINTRGGYLEAATHMEGSPEQRQILVYGASILSSRLVAFNAKLPAESVEVAETISDLVGAAVIAHQQGSPLWLVLEDMRSEATPEDWRALESQLSAQQIPFDRECFLGFQTILVYGIPPLPE